MKPRCLHAATLVAALAVFAPPCHANGSITVGRLAVAPVLDGDLSEWARVEPHTVPLRQSRPGGNSDVESVDIRIAVHGDEVFVALRWKDSSEDIVHKPFSWSDAEYKYVSTEKMEDRLALQFAMDGNYSTNWLSGNAFVADMWHWKAHRSNALGLVHDKRTIISTEVKKKAWKGSTADGRTIYIQRPSDRGPKLYTTRRYRTREEPVMPKYILNENVSGSVADVKAGGVWADGMWTLELRRKLDTGHDDDVVFTPGAAVLGGIAVFNHSGDDDHNVSEVLSFQF